MANCEYIDNCPFFKEQLNSMPSTSNWLKQQYCQGTFEKCARYAVRSALGPGTVPPNLFPEDHSRAKLVIARGKP